MGWFYDDSSFTRYLKEALDSVLSGNTELFAFVAMKPVDERHPARIGFNEIKPIAELNISALPAHTLQRMKDTNIPISQTTITFQGSGISLKTVHLILYVDLNRPFFRELGRVSSDYSNFQYETPDI